MTIKNSGPYKGENWNYGTCSLCGRPINRERSYFSHYCSSTCANLVRRYGYGTKRPKNPGTR